MRRRPSLLSVLILVGLLGPTAFGCTTKRQSRTSRVAVRTAVASETSMPFQLTSVGTVEAIRSASVAAQVSGVITQATFREGQLVRAGQVLFRLDARPFRAALDQALAVRDRDRARAEAARKEADRARTLYNDNVLSESEWEQKRSDAEALAATVRADSAAVNTARLNLEFASIRAPSFIHPLTILSGLPFAGFGALLALLIFRIDLSIYAFVGIIMLVGLVKKNAIMMIDFALDAERNQGKPPREAIVEAALVRFRPIMMTTMAALMGTLPIAIGLGAGAEARRPLGIAVVGGLAFSQLVTLYVTPVIYTYLDALQQRLRRRKRGDQPAVAAREVDSGAPVPVA